MQLYMQTKLKMIVIISTFLLLLPLAPLVAAAADSTNNTITKGQIITKLGCPRECGSVTVPYPFGIGPGCSFDHPTFQVECNTSSSDPPKPFLVLHKLSDSDDNEFNIHELTNLEITEISDTQVRVKSHAGYTCFNGSGKTMVAPMVSLNKTYLSLSDVNRLTGIGCDDVSVIMNTYEGRGSMTGCVTLCTDQDFTSGECNGNGCCQTNNLRNGSQLIEWAVASVFNHSKVFSFNPCGYAFLGDVEGFRFGGISDLNNHTGLLDRISDQVSMVLDWGIGNKSCSDSPPCYDNSTCVDTNSPTGLVGYRCKCFDGFEGNPYLPDAGCRDINECDEPDPCSGNYTRCENQPAGTYTCYCVEGYTGNATSGQGCFPKKTHFPVLGSALGITVSLLGIVVGASWIYFIMKKRKAIKQKEKFFQTNGGFILKQHTSRSQDGAKIFTTQELERATNNYADDRILGRGGYGTVYKGILPDNSVVAIKKSRIMDRNHIELFINEVVILTRVIHRNVVKLIGCCLETEVPLLVYEFVSNGDLFHHIHNSREAPWFSWDNRLRIAAEAAGALAYLHSSVAMPIIHRDVKSANILLDDFHTAKVADFGASRLVPLNQTWVTTLIQGTPGYVDPEYFQSSQLTDKSDVYSFGVVLAELMTERMPILSERNLGMVFLVSLKQNRLLEILAPRVSREGNVEQIHGVAEVVRRCLKLKGEERPTMKEVAAELDRLRKGGNHHPWDNDKDVVDEENVSLVSGQYSGDLYPVTSFCLESFSKPNTPR